MNKEQFLKAFEENADLRELTKGHSYIVQIEVGDMPKENVARFASALSEKLTSIGLKDVLITPTSNGQGCLKFYEVRDGKLFEYLE